MLYLRFRFRLLSIILLSLLVLIPNSTQLYSQIESLENASKAQPDLYLKNDTLNVPTFNESEFISPQLTSPLLRTELVVRGLDTPVGIAFLDSDDFLIIEKNTGKVKRFTNGSLLNQTLLDVNVANENERGLVGIAISKDNPSNKTFVFLYYTESKDKDGEDYCPGNKCDPEQNSIGNRLYRYELKDNSLINPKLLLDIPASTYPMHHGGKLVIGKDKNLYIGVGDLNNDTRVATNVKYGIPLDGTGGIIRLTQNGSEVLPSIFGDTYPYYLYYAYGIRNVFGLGFDPLTGNLWDTENGPGFGDEINLVLPGFNSGWSVVSGVRDTSNFTGGNITLNPKNLIKLNGIGEYSLPELTWDRPTVTPTSIILLNTTKYGPAFENNMIVAVAKPNGNLFHFDLVNNRTELLLNKTTDLSDKAVTGLDGLKPYLFGENFGGIADLELSPDGYLYVVSFFQNAIFKIIPTKSTCIYCSGTVSS